MIMGALRIQITQLEENRVDGQSHTIQSQLILSCYLKGIQRHPRNSDHSRWTVFQPEISLYLLSFLLSQLLSIVQVSPENEIQNNASRKNTYSENLSDHKILQIVPMFSVGGIYVLLLHDCLYPKIVQCRK